MSQTTLVNGDVSQSAFVEHLTSYPLISNSIATYKSYPLGAHTIALAHQGYNRFVIPFLTHPFAQEQLKPRVSPYLHKADHFGDESLRSIDSRFPVLREDPQVLQSHLWSFLQQPFVLADQSKKHVYGIYNQEYQKQGGAGYVAGVKALFTTSLVTASETLAHVATWVGKKEDEIKSKVDAKVNEK